MSNQELFTFADLNQWSDQRLLDHHDGLVETSKIPHSEPRGSQIRRELAHVAFELDMRTSDRENFITERL